MAKADIWMPFYIADYLADTTRLTTEQHGAYVLLILDYWRNGPPPNDPQTLAQITRMSPDAWSNASSRILAFFEQRDGMLYHGRIEREKVEASSNKDKKQAKAKAAAEARWGKNASGNAPSNAQAMPEQCPSPSPSPSPIGDKKDIGAGAPMAETVIEQRAEILEAIEHQLETKLVAPTPAPKAQKPDATALPDWMPLESWNGYIDMRKKQKKPPTARAVELLIGVLGKMRDAGHDIAVILDTSTKNCWTDVYLPRDDHRTGARPNGRPSSNNIGLPPGADDNIFDQMRRELP